MRISGVPIPPFFAANYIMIRYTSTNAVEVKAVLTYVRVHLVGKFGTEDGGAYESNAKPNVCQTSDSDVEVVYIRKEG